MCKHIPRQVVCNTPRYVAHLIYIRFLCHSLVMKHHNRKLVWVFQGNKLDLYACRTQLKFLLEIDYNICKTKKFVLINIIQIWTCDEGNMEFYGSEATILTKAKPRSIFLPKIHKTYIACLRHHRSIFALLYVKCSSILVYGYIYC